MIPVYTEVSNRERTFLRLPKRLSIVLHLKVFANPVSTLNSLYQLLQQREDVELVLIAEEKDAYQYENLMERFPVLRVIFPETPLAFPQVLRLACQESFSQNVMFLDDRVVLETLPMEIFSLYFEDPQYGVIVPHCFSVKREVIPSQVKPTLRNGFLATVSWDKPQNAIPVMYPVYFCCIVNKEMFLSREFSLKEYENSLYTLAEFGWRVWKQGFWVIQVRQWRVVLDVFPVTEMTFSEKDEEYFLFHYRNVTHKSLVFRQNTVLFSLFLRCLFTLKWRMVGKLWRYLAGRKRIRQELAAFPIEDLAIFSIINNEKA
ncbi:MAG: hypothetical protein N2314_00820 [Brevinematales bacterium]|nr:hypothetical protein [Brevinematales bacterium]